MSTGSTPETNPPSQRRRRRKSILASLILLFLFALVVVLIAPRPSGDKFTWLTPAEMARATSGGLLGQAKARFRWILTPISRLIHRKPKSVFQVNTHVWKIPFQTTNQFDLGTSVSTNADGLRVWILSGDKLAAFQNRLNNPQRTISSSSTTAITADGVQSKTFVGNTLAGLNVDVLGHVTGTNFNLLLGLSDTESIVNAATATPSVKTNFAFSCRTTIPRAGALVIGRIGSSSNQLWVVITPAQIVTDKPVKR